MKRKWYAIEISTVSVIILILTSLINVVGYQTVQTSQQNEIKERINQRELLFQTIVDIANNKEIQRIILKSQMSRGIFPTSEMPVITKQQIRQMYFLGLILSKVISKSRIQSMVQQYQFSNQEIQQEISTVIEKDTTLNAELTQLKDSDCVCDNVNTTLYWRFPVVCLLIFPIIFVLLVFNQIVYPIVGSNNPFGFWAFILLAFSHYGLSCRWLDYYS